jgi:hypothetical protein
MFDFKKYVSLSRAARHLHLAVDDLCAFIVESRIPTYADSDFARPENSDEPYMFPIKTSSIEKVLAADKIVHSVEFIYPSEFKKKWRLSGSPTDEQKISRKDLYLIASDLKIIEQTMDQSVGFEENKKKRSLVENKSTRIKGLIGQGSHWEAKRQKLLSAANVELRANFHKYKKPNGKVNYSKLAEFLDKNRKSWIGLKEKNARSLDPKRIAEWLSRFDKDGLLQTHK